MTIPKLMVMAAAWGEPYIRLLLDLSVPSWLAPGNLPSLIAAADCEVVFLVPLIAMPAVLRHPSAQALGRLCRLRCIAIDDLIDRDQSGVTLTTAYARGIQDVGAAAPETGFILLNADFVLADGTLRTMLDRVRAGCDAVISPSLRCVAEQSVDPLRRLVAAGGGVLEIKPRDLVAVALKSLHPSTAANIVNQPLAYNTLAHQLLWWGDEQTLLGHFFLMFVLYLRPRRALEAVPGFCDYAFLEALCPAAQLSVIADSDDGFVMEVQNQSHEVEALRLGGRPLSRLAADLNGWTTVQHRLLSRQPLLFHAGTLPATIDALTGTAREHIDRLHAALAPAAQPVHHHPFWEASRQAAARTLGLRGADWRDHARERAADQRIAPWRRLLRTLTGTPPRVSLVHRDWPDHHHAVVALDGLVRTGTPRLLYCASEPNPYDQLLASYPGPCRRIDIFSLLCSGDRGAFAAEAADACFCYVTNRDVGVLRTLIEAVRSGLKHPPRTWLVMVHDTRRTDRTGAFALQLVRQLRALAPFGFDCDAIRFQGSARSRWLRNMSWSLAERIAETRGGSVAQRLGLLALMPVILVSNLMGRSSRVDGSAEQCTSVLMRFTDPSEERQAP